jgi:hypothetical protein
MLRAWREIIIGLAVVAIAALAGALWQLESDVAMLTWVLKFKGLMP